MTPSPRDKERAAPLSVPASLRRSLLTFYRAHRRDLPWRRSRDPYAIWVSEIMLQQTQVDTVMPRYAAFLALFPTVAHLAAATEESVCEAWAGLGYYRRARYLHKAARQIMAEHAGCLPADVVALQKLAGIGRYTAGAIASIAFGLPAPLVDGNVIRLLSRLFALTDTAESPAGKKVLWHLAEALVQGEAPGDLNQALMEMGATVCTPYAPKCGACPVRKHCAGLRAGDPTLYPTPSPKIARKPLPIAFAYAEDATGVWLSRRPLDGLWAGLWELPSAAGPTARADLAAQLGQRLGKALVTVEHTLTHRDVLATVYRIGKPRWVGHAALVCNPKPLSAPLSALARKAILAVQAQAV